MVSHAPATFYCLFYTLRLQEIVFITEQATAKTIINLRLATALYSTDTHILTLLMPEREGAEAGSGKNKTKPTNNENMDV